MRFARPPRRPRPEAVVPMINVVFLLLIFFLMTSELAPAPPLEVEPPLAEAQPATGENPVLYVAADGGLAFGTARGEAALSAAAALAPETRLAVLADAALPAPELTRLLVRLGRHELDLTVRR